MSIGDTSAKMIMKTDEWRTGINSATMTLRTHGRKVKEILFGSKTATEKYSMKLAELNAMSKKFGLTEREVAFQTARLKEQFLGIVPAATRAKRAMAGLKSMAMGYAGPTVAVFAGGMAARRAEGIRQEMQSSLAIMGEVSDEMKAVMRDTAYTVAMDTKFSAAEASKAYYFLASAGMDAAQSVAALPTVSKFAQSGMFDLSRATDLLTDAQMALGMSSTIVSQNLENMTRVGDVLVGANTIANASVEQFAESLTNKAAAALRMVNKDIEEGVAWLAVYASQGIKGADAGTALSIVLRDLQTKSIKNSAAFAELGVAVYDSSGKMNNLADIIADMERAMEGMSAKGKKAALIQLGLSDKSVAYTQVLIGMSQAGRDFEEQLDSMAGKMDEVSDKQLTKFAEGWERIKGVWDKLVTHPIGQLLDAMGPVMEFAAGGEGTTEKATARGALQIMAEDVTRGGRRPGEYEGMGILDRDKIQYMVPVWAKQLGMQWGAHANLGRGDQPTLAQEERRRVHLENKMTEARQRVAESSTKQQEFDARMATRAGLAQSWLTQQGRGFAAGARDTLRMLGKAGETTAWGVGRVAAGQQWDVTQAQKAREAEAKVQAKAIKAEDKAVKALFESTRTPMERFKADLADAGKWFSVGAITEDTFTRRAEMLRAQTLDEIAPEKASRMEFATADVYGSEAAISAIARAKAPGMARAEDKASRERQETNLILREEIAGILERVVREIKKIGPTEMDTPP